MAAKKPKITTLDELAAHTDKRIDELTVHTDKRIDELTVHTDKRIDGLMAHTDKHIDTRFDELAVLINGGFNSTQKYLDRRLDKMDGRLDKMDTRLAKVEDVLKDVSEETANIQADVRYLRSEADIPIRNEELQNASIKDLKIRVNRLEQKAGFAK